MDIKSEVTRRRTFAIISHPDAGKTTLTEKLLLFGGAIQEAGTVKAKKSKKRQKNQNISGNCIKNRCFGALQFSFFRRCDQRNSRNFFYQYRKRYCKTGD